MTLARRVVVGISGGVDSAVSALLLKRRGFDVTAVYMVNWDGVEEGTSECPRTKDEADARTVAQRLSIPFHTVNFVKEYWNEVFDRMLSNYSRGRTVVPDIACNRHIKFEHLHRIARERFNIDCVATGHYASTSRGDFGEEEVGEGAIRLLRGVDPLKDQTYFLSTLRQHQLRRAMFPLGSMTKREVKRIAEDNGLGDIAKRPESMGVCFVGKRKNFGEFMEQYITVRPGRLVSHSTGEVLGEHGGVHLFTLGKRLSITPRSHLGHFVARIDENTGDVYVVEGSNHPSLYAREFVIERPEWICGEPKEGSSLSCGIQRTHSPLPCSISSWKDNSLLVRPLLPLRAVANGQMCVFYNGRECLGGGEVIGIKQTLEDS